MNRKNILMSTCLIILFTAGIINAQGLESGASQMRLSATVGAEVPTGNFSDFWGVGWGLNVTFEYWQNSPLSFIGTVGYNWWTPKNDTPADYKYSTVPLMFGFRYYFTRGEIHPYLGTELGAQFTKYSRETTSGNTVVSTDVSDTRFGFSPFLGMKARISRSMDIDVNVKYNIITTDPNTTFLGVNAGVQLGL